ncbi:MAG: alpha-amylase family glycosyl hydrolase [Eubacteriales bacterium]|nr:alpha-amylase family glycosyl hydrolase [Eubacteriales bacterium]
MLRTNQKTWDIDRSAALFCVPGAIKEKDGVRFTVSVPAGQEASLLLYDKKSRRLLQETDFCEEASVGRLRSVKVIGLPWRRTVYCFKIGGRIVCDPYAAFICDTASGGSEEAEERNEENVYCGLAFESYDWQEDKRPRIPYEEGVMYHLHVRNFTKHAKSGVRHKGTFLGLQEKIPYLKELGVNQVKLMPIYELKTQPESSPEEKRYPEDTSKKEKPNCWGYGAGYYFAPKARYSAGANPVIEFKDMVKAMHKNGIEVLLEMFFTQDTPLREILDCLSFWVREYHVDGFHLMGREDIGPLLAHDPILMDTKLLVGSLPGWQEKRGAKEQTAYRTFAECSDGFLVDMRRILKGDEGILEQFAFRSRRNSDGFGIINYITNHDGFTLQDLVSYDNKHNEENGEMNRDGAAYNFSWNCGAEGPTRKKAVLSLRKRQIKNAFLLMTLSQGTPMFLAGDEFGNSQGGNNNPYCLDNKTSWVDWSLCQKNAWLTEFVKQAVAFRKKYKILHMPRELQMADYRSCGYPDLSYHSSHAWYSRFEYNSRQLGMMYCGYYSGEDVFLYVAYNFHPLAQELALPKLPNKMRWYMAADTSREESFLPVEEALPEDERIHTFPGRTVTVLIGKKEEKQQ